MKGQDQECGKAYARNQQKLNERLAEIAGGALADERKLDQIERLLDKGAQADQASEHGIAALGLCVMSSATKSAIRLLKESGVNPNERVSRSYAPGWSLAHWAAARGDQDLLEALLTAGADPSSRSRKGDTPLLVANGHADAGVIASLLNAGASLDEVNERKESALIKAIQRADEKSAIELLRLGINPALKDLDGKDALSWMTEASTLIKWRQDAFERVKAGVLESLARWEATQLEKETRASESRPSKSEARSSI